MVFDIPSVQSRAAIDRRMLNKPICSRSRIDGLPALLPGIGDNITRDGPPLKT